MVSQGENIYPDEYVDIELEIQNITQKEGDVAYYATAVTNDDSQVMLTVFQDNLPDINIKSGNKYYFSDLKGEIWKDGSPAVKFTSISSVRHVGTGIKKSYRSADESRKVERGYNIDEGELVSIELRVEELERVGKNKIAYRAWCSDQYGDLVIFTAFENNKPDADLDDGKQYEFQNVVGERWNDGTPGIKSTGSTTVQQVHTRRDEPEPTATGEGVRELVINAIDKRQFFDKKGDDRGWLGRMPTGLGVVISGVVTGVGILASVFAGDLGFWTKLFFVGGGATFAGVVAYVTQYQPASRLQIRRKQKHSQVFLKILLQDYFELVNDTPEVRANVMTISSDGVFRTDSLRIFSSVGAYEGSELEATYAPTGNCGPWSLAFADLEIVTYDRESKHESIADLEAGQEKNIEDVRSSISVPIYTDTVIRRDSIGVLTLDSSVSLEEAGFTEKEVQTLLRRYSTLLGEVLE